MPKSNLFKVGQLESWYPAMNNLSIKTFTRRQKEKKTV